MTDSASRAAACAAASFACSLAIAVPALGQDAPTRSPADSGPLQIVVTANRSPQPIQRAGSAITVVTREELIRSNPTSLVDALRAVPGVDVTETGGPGAVTTLRLRGANTGQTLVLIDGVRANDPSSASGEFDFSTLLPTAVERIEVLRGPQSALYGSDAIGGVVNIITRRGRGPARFELRQEAGSYGTLATNGTLAGSIGPWSYALSGGGQRSTGFSRYGERIGRLERRSGPFERDGFERFGGFGRVGYDAGDGLRFEIGGLSTTTFADYDLATGAFPDTPAFAERRFHQVHAKGAVDTLGGVLTHQLQVFANRTERTFRDVSFSTTSLPRPSSRTRSEFTGDRIGAEYQGDVKLDAFGSLIVGGRLERETADTFNTGIIPTPGPRRREVAAEQETRSAFALWQVPVGERLTLSLGGRIDDVVQADRFATWRATASYLIPESGTKLRASAGTGGKAPTLFQLFSPNFGNPSLSSEESLGIDGGFDQSFANGRVNLSVTGFFNRFDDLIEFDSRTSRYFNVAEAETTGIEVAGDAEIWEGLLRLKAAYTYLDAKDRQTGLTLARRPEHLARLSLAITPTSRWLVEPRLTLVSERYSSPGERGRLAPYARLDIHTDYRLDETWRVFARLENVTDAAYQEVLNYGTTGRAVYAGFNATW